MITLIIYDYDAAPDAEAPYFVSKRVKRYSLADATRDAHYYVEERFFVGAKKFIRREAPNGH